MSRRALVGLLLASGCLRPNPGFDGGDASGSGSASESSASDSAGSITTDATGATGDPTTGAVSGSATGTASTTDDCQNCACAPGAVEPCYSGPAATEGVGSCKAGMRTCDMSGVWGACEGEVTPTTDVCGNGSDEDCDGAADDELACMADPECPQLAGLVACYPFPPAVVDQLHDGSGLGHHGTMSGVSLVDGMVDHGKTGKFGLDSAASVAEHPDLSPDHFTVVALIRPPELGVSTAGVVDKENQFGLLLTAGILECVVVSDTPEIMSLPVAVPSGMWSLVACSFDGSQVRLARYAGGGPEVLTDAMSGKLNPNGDDNGMRVGNNSPEGNLPYEGELDFVLLFDRALAPEELCTLAGPLCP